MKFKDYYETLGLQRTATQDEVKQAYRKLARKFHPDVSKETDAEARFKEVGEAYEVLKDPEKRAAYDRVGADSRGGWKGGQDFQPPPGWDEGFEFSGPGTWGSPESGVGEGQFGANPSDFFEALFGQHARQARAQRRTAQARGQDHHAKILIELEDAYKGARRSIGLHFPVVDEQGRVTTQERTLDVTIPKGIREGQHLRLTGQGEAGGPDGKPGDLYLEIGFKPHPLFHVDGGDVYLDLPVAPWEAALGATVNAPTPEGSVKLNIPAGTVAGRKLRLKGKGIPGKTPGDLYVTLAITLPPAQTEAAREAYRAMAKGFDFNPRTHLEGASS
ncbi:MAG: cbpA1 [Rhodocyclales bacterium]|nr:cbpA1 [Rhodocyclales bacterium]